MGHTRKRPPLPEPVAAVTPGHRTRTTRAHRSRSIVALSAAALLAVGVATQAVPAAASPGTGQYETAFTTSLFSAAADIAADPYTGQVFVSRAGAIDIVDEYSGTVFDSVWMGSISSFRLAADPTRAYVWALDPSSHQLSRIDERTNTVTGSPVVIAGDLKGLTVDHTTGTVYVAAGSTGTVVPVDEQTLAQGTAITLPGAASVIGSDPSAGVLYVGDAAGAVSIIDEASGTVTSTVPVTAGATSIAVDPTNHRAYLGFPSTPSLTVVNGAAGTTTTIPLSSGVDALGIDPTTQTVVAAQGGTVYRVDTGSGSVKYWWVQTDPVTSPTVAVDPYTNTLFFGKGSNLTALWEPTSILGTVSGVVAAGKPYSQTLSGYTSNVNGTLSYAITAGALPTGLSLVGATIKGTATTPGSSTFSLTATDAAVGESVTQTYSLHVVAVSRTAGADRYATSVAVSQAAYPDPSTVGTVYVANGLSFPDALASGPAAAEESGPLLLTAPGSLPASVSAEITRLHPAHIVVVGGSAVVSDAVFSALQKLSTDVQRVYGADRFATSRAIISRTFTSAPIVYVATGMDFPDSLSAGGAAGSLHAPLLLVNGKGTSVDSATAALLQSFGHPKIVAIGGDGVMSPSLVADLQNYGTVTRLAGLDRYQTSQYVVESSFANSSKVMLANGLTFADALGASAWSGKSSSPLFITSAGCVPQRTLDDIYFLGATSVSLIGGTGALTTSIDALTSCGGWSVIAPTYPAVAAGASPAAKDGSKATTIPFDHPVAPGLRVAPRTRP